MRILPLITLSAAAMAVAAGPLAAQQATQAAAPQYDRTAAVTLEGTADTVHWSMEQGRLFLQPASGSQLWEIALPDTQTMLAKGLSAELLSRGAPLTVRAYKARDACTTTCKAEAIEITVKTQGKTYALQGAASAG
jgi:hypothetical protein